MNQRAVDNISHGEIPLPPLTVVLGVSGAERAAWSLARFAAGAGYVRLIASSAQQALTRIGQAAAMGVAVAEPGTAINGVQSVPPGEDRAAISAFHAFTGALLHGANEDDRRAVPRAFQRLALAEICRTHLRSDDFFGRMLTAPGFVPALTERIREWKLAGITPDALESAAPAAVELLDDPAFGRKSAEMARLFRAYEALLERSHLRDEEDCLRLAARIAADETKPLPGQIRTVIVDGFYRFNPAQRLLLAALCGRGAWRGIPEIEVVITLPHDPTRPLLFAAPHRTLATLQADFECRQHLLPPAQRAPDSPLLRLGKRLFRGAHDETTTEADPQYSANEPGTAPPPIIIHDAPNPYVEVEMVARTFRRLYDGGGYAWSDFAIVLRGMGDYTPILASIFERYAIPLGADGHEKLTENPLIKTVLHLLRIVRWGWQREDVLAFLKSSYTAPDPLAADALRRRVRSAGVREGRDRWLVLTGSFPPSVSTSLLTSMPVGKGNPPANLTTPEAASEGRATSSNGKIGASAGRRGADIDAVVSETLWQIARFEDLLVQESLTPARFAECTIDAMVQFGMVERIASGEPTRVLLDRAAFAEAQELLHTLAQMAQISGRHRVAFAALHEELLGVWNTPCSMAPSEGDMVRVCEPYDALERPVRVAAVIGLVERVFPRRVTEDPFLRDEERAALRAVGGLDLELLRDRADDERFFFYLAVTAPSERLLLSYPRSSKESDTLPSFYIDEVRAVFPAGSPALRTVSRTLADVAPRLEETVTAGDRLLAACAVLFDPTEAEKQTITGEYGKEIEKEGKQNNAGESGGRYVRKNEGGNAGKSDNEASEERLEAKGVGEKQAADGAGGNGRAAALRMLASCLEDDRTTIHAIVASRREPKLPRLVASDLLHSFAAHKKVYSVTELETYGRCPFQYLLRHVLRLQPETDGADARDQGTLLHAVLRRYFRGRRRQKPAPEPHDDAEMRTELHRLLEDTLEREKMDATPHRLRIAHRVLADALSEFSVRETQFTPQFAMTPTFFELSFGSGAAGAEPAEDDDRGGLLTEKRASELATDGNTAAIYDAASCTEPLEIVGEDGATVQICGTIDRVDLSASGRHALLIDYKLGASPDSADILQGKSLQMPLYLLAMERLFGIPGAVACYDTPREPGRKRLLRTEFVNTRQFAPLPSEEGKSVTILNRDQFGTLVKTAETKALQTALAIAGGGIAATPGDHCRTCVYTDVCRTSATGHDGEPLLPTVPVPYATAPPAPLL